MAPQPDAASAYRQASFEHAPPLKILRMLYQGALRFLDQAKELDPAKEPAARNDCLLRADAIVCELRLSLEADVAPDLCDQLERLYLFVEEQILQARERRAHEPIESARQVLQTLLDGWKQVEVESEHCV